MKSFLFAYLLVSTACAQSTGDFRSVRSGPFEDVSTWERFSAGSWRQTQAVPDRSAPVTTIRDGHTVTLAGTASLGGITIANNGQLTGAGNLTIAGDIENDGELDLKGVAVTWSGNVSLSGTGSSQFGSLNITQGSQSRVSVSMACEGPVAVSSGSNVIFLARLTLGSTLSVLGSFESKDQVMVNGSVRLLGGGSKRFTDIVIGGADTLTSSVNAAVNGSISNDGIVQFDDGILVIDSSVVSLVGQGLTSLASIRVDSGAEFQQHIPVLVSETVTVSDGGFWNASDDLTCRGDVSITGSFWSSSTVHFTDSTSLTGTGTKNFSILDISGRLRINGNYSVDTEINVTGALIHGSVTLTVNGNVTYNVRDNAIGSFYNITILSNVIPFTFVAPSDLVIEGATLRFNNGIIMVMQQLELIRDGTTRITGSGSAYFHNIHVAEQTTFRPNFPITIDGDFLIDGSVIAGSTMSFAGRSQLTGRSTSVVSLTNVTVSPNAELSASLGLLTLTGNLNNNGTINAGDLALNFTSSSTKTISGTSVLRVRDIQVANGTAPIDLLFNSTVEMTGLFTVASGAQVDVNGASGTGKLLLRSLADDPTVDATIGPLTGGAAVFGNVTVQRYLSIEGPHDRIYRYISSPVSPATVSDIQQEVPVTGGFTGSSFCDGCTSHASMFWYDETADGTTDNGYIAFPRFSNADTLATGRGYALFVRADIDPIKSIRNAGYDLTGKVHQGQVSLPVTYTDTGNAGSDGWNLIGNPYPSAIDWNGDGWTRTGISGAIYMLDNGRVPSRYAIWNGSVGVNGGTSVIAQGQGFFVRAFAEGPQLAVSEVAKTNTPTSVFRRPEPRNIVRIRLSDGTNADEAVIHFAEGATDGFDYEFDALKIRSADDDAQQFNIATVLADGSLVAINTLPMPGCAGEIIIDIANAHPGQYSMSIAMSSHDFTASLSDSGAKMELTEDFVYRFSMQDGDRAKQLRLVVVPTSPVPFELTSKSLCADQPGIFEVKTSLTSDLVAIIDGIDVFRAVSEGGRGVVTVPASQLPIGSTPIMILATPKECPWRQASVHDTVRRAALLIVKDVRSTVVCKRGIAVLEALGTTPGSVVNWYENVRDTIVLARGATYETPVLTSSRTYFVALQNPSGCEGPRSRAVAEVQNYEDAMITVVNNEYLCSNYEEGNHWFLNEELLDTAARIPFNAGGYYRLEVLVGSCRSLVVGEFKSSERQSLFQPFPNPTRDKILITSCSYPFDVIVQDLAGVVVCKIMAGPEATHEYQLDLSDLSCGEYIVRVVARDSTTSYRWRVIKE